MSKQQARLENWVLFGDTLIGQIADHPRQEDFKKEFQRTSRLVRFDPENGIAETQNTLYALGAALAK